MVEGPLGVLLVTSEGLRAERVEQLARRFATVLHVAPAGVPMHLLPDPSWTTFEWYGDRSSARAVLREVARRVPHVLLESSGPFLFLAGAEADLAQLRPWPDDPAAVHVETDGRGDLVVLALGAQVARHPLLADLLEIVGDGDVPGSRLADLVRAVATEAPCRT